MKTLLRYFHAIFNVTKRTVCNEFVIIILAIVGSYTVSDGLSQHTVWIVDTMVVVFFLMSFVGVVGLLTLIWDAIKKEAEHLKNG